MQLIYMGDRMQIIRATLEDYPVIQNMAQFYAYDISREYEGLAKALIANNFHMHFDYKSYFIDPTRKAFLVKVNEELAGFVLLNDICISPETQYNIGEFFIIAKFQRHGIGEKIAHKIWQMYPGRWEVSVIPELKGALVFWRKTISGFTSEYKEGMVAIDYDTYQPQRYIFSFDT